MTNPASPVPTSDARARRIQWFHEARWGMFIHWGAYSVAGRGEWVMNRERIPLDEYTRLYVENFHAENFDPDAWVRLARDAGMGYMVLTARHHDGFALWDTATREFNSVRHGPRRDLVAAYVDAVRRGGLKVGLYYSVADWTHPDYPDAFARDWPQVWQSEAARQRFIAYYRAQLTELMTHYGPIDLLWYDGCIPGPLDGAETNAIVRSLQPDILINSRNGPQKEDFVNCEQAIRPPKEPIAWEACMTLNSTWGYHAGDSAWKSPRAVVQLLTETARHGGNLLLNVGPYGDGSIPEPSVRILREVGAWLQRYGEFLPNSERSPFSWTKLGNVTVRGRTVYLHILQHVGSSLCYAEIANRVRGVRLVENNRPLPFRQEGSRLFIENLPQPFPNPIGISVAVEVDGIPAAITPQTTFWVPG
ncbi:MAG TPA: alpha-L-fucosidase [Phycisphaerales bacterium]|nr:alpha-L-fucosidase [Phycisphaerales bacterium]